MSGHDLTSPFDMEIAEDVTAAVVRAMTGESDIRYRRHLLHAGRRAVAVRAPHVHPDSATADMEDLRGSGDGIALRIMHSDSIVYREHLPQDAFEELLYEMLEQFRVEALAPASQTGTKSNLHHRFADWSDGFIAEGLLENDLGLLLFTVMHVCRSRILGEPIEERANDHTEATRAGIYQVLGPHLVDLRPNIRDQGAFATIAAAIAKAIGELASSVTTTSTTGRLTSTILAMLQFDSSDIMDDISILPAAAGASRTLHSEDYAVFTVEYDRTVDVGDLVLPHGQSATRLELDALIAEQGSIASYLARSVLTLFPAPLDSEWVSEQQQGRIDPRLLSRVVTSPGDDLIFRMEVDAFRPQAAVTFLIDCSGSMKANIPQVAALVDLMTRALDQVDVVTEVLGFTTGSWNGGRAHKDWLTSGRAPHPGRLNEVCQIIFKSATTSWRRARRSISALLWTPMFREGIDGESLEWAYTRLLGIDVPHRALILISDGSPMDGATSLTNGEEFLDRHLTDVAAAIESSGQVLLYGLGLGHDMSSYVRRSRIVDPQQILTPGVAKTLIGFLAEASMSTSVH